jgi:hypothetical protein
MAESKFLKYQDKNRDFLIDVCEVELPPPEEQVCKDCVPNPKALVPNWKTFEALTPFLNEKICQYQISITTPETTTGAGASSTELQAQEALQELYSQYAEEAIEAFLEYYQKAVSDSNFDMMREAVEYWNYDLDPRPNSHLKLLYSFPFEILSQLDAEEEAEDDEDEDSEDIVVEFEAARMNVDLIRVRKSLNLYSRYEKVYRFTDGGTLRFTESGGLFNLPNYGDAGLLPGSSITANLIPQLDSFLNEKGFNIPGVGGLSGLFEDKVTKIEFTFSPEYKAKKLRVYTETCGEKPTVLKKLKRLNKKSSWRDPTAVAYFAQMKKMERDLTARVPKPWLEFLKEYTYPQIDAVINAGYTNTDPENTAISCIADNLAGEAKQLGQDILDDVFGIGDAIALQFHKALCNEEYKDLLEQKIKFGQIPSQALLVSAQGKDVDQIDATKFVPTGESDEVTKNIGAFAIEQAFKELDENDQVFSNFCALLLSGASGGGDLTRQLDLLWANGLDKIRICGLFDLMLDAIQCLFKGLTLEEALASMLQSALTAMSLENFADLFVGLPPDKQQELDALVQKKLQSGDIFRPDSQQQRVSDEAAKGENTRLDVDNDPALLGNIQINKPWENPELISEQNKKLLRENSYSSESPTGIPPANTRKSDVGDATVKAQLQNVGSQLNPALVMDAYIAALIEVYSDNLLDLLDILNRFPGAQIIAKVISLIDCPIPPIFDPSLMDFLKDIELPFCRNTQHIGLPRLENPFAYLPKLKDLFRILFQIIKIELQKLVVRIIIKLIVKICELIGDAICKALEAVGDIAAALPALATGRTTFKDVIRETICGPQADEEKIDDTIADMFQQMSAGGAAFSDRAAVLSFAEDISAATSRRELTDAVLGNPSETFLKVMESLVEFEYPQFAAAFNNRENIGSFFGNIGNLMPLEAKQALKDFAAGLSEDDQLPANPTLCATPEQIEDFCNLRSGLLEGRASPEQIAKLCDSARDTFKNDIEDLATILNDGIPNYLNNNLPPILSDPGCSNGLLPFEPEEIAKATTKSLDGNMEQLKIAYTYDMIGNGPFERNWGFINMVLSDTEGNPYTAHLRKSANSGRIFKKDFVDFYVNTESEVKPENDTKYAKLKRQHGAFPMKVADWMQEEMPRQIAASSFDSNNQQQDDIQFYKTFEDLRFDGLFGDVNLLALPDYGYNTDVGVDFAGERIKFTKKARKSKEDIRLEFRDNAKGTGGFSYGFEVNLFLSDIEKENGDFINRSDDNCRILIRNVVNTKAKVDAADSSYEDKDDSSSKSSSNTEESILRWRAYEFAAVDNGLEGVDTITYPRYYETTQQKKTYIPQVYLLKDLLEKYGTVTLPSDASVKTAHDAIMNAIFNNFAEQIHTNDSAFVYGAALDDLTYEDVEYVDPETGKPYEDAGYSDEDAVLGISRDQFNNGEENARVIYLDPAKFGGSYINPPVYIKPIKNDGWLGLIDVMFPEIGPCKPYRSDLVDFGSIQKRIGDSYNSIPEDERLRTDPDCAREEPYNRILERPSKAGIEGIISAAIRIYASVHLLKGLATFTKFKPDFVNSFSRINAQYVIEKMEEDFKDAQPVGGFEFFNPFKDEEFWYAFLEQSVQTYARRYASGQLPDPPGPVVDALTRIEEIIKKHRNIYKDTYTTNDGRTIVGLKDAKKMGDAPFLQSLKNYRADKNLEVIQETESDAKIILQELVIEELEFMGNVFMENLNGTSFAENDVISDLRKYVLESLCVGSSLDIDKEIREQVEELPTEGEDLYSAGSELITLEGEDYVGYYHVHIDEEGDPVYMVGPYHTEEDHDLLRVSAKKIVVPIGDVDWVSTDMPTPDKPFKLEKYIRIGDQEPYGSNDDAKQALLDAANDAGLEPDSTNISDLFPGTMELVYDENGAEIGITGELGVRYGLQLSTAQGVVARVEVDALDLPVTEFQPLEAKTKLLLCLVNNLLDDPDFNAVVKYVFPLSKILSTLSVYNDLAFVPSIGEKVVDYDRDSNPPGRFIAVTDNGDGTFTSTLEDSGSEGWLSAEDRNPGFFAGNGLFLLHYDKWDQNILTKSKFRIKKLFKGFYNTRDFDPEGDDAATPGEAFLASLRASFKPAAGQRLLPWWKRRMLRTNPFNADGALCDKKD